MNSYIEEFLSFLKKEDDLDYGDFKREVDLHLSRLMEGLRPMTHERLLRLQKLREELLWMYNDDVPEMKAHLQYEIERLEQVT